MGLAYGVLVDDQALAMHGPHKTSNDINTQLVKVSEYTGGNNNCFHRDPTFKPGGPIDNEIRKKLKGQYGRFPTTKVESIKDNDDHVIES